jgi:hypothetical protein
VRQQAIQRLRHAAQLELVNEQRRVLMLATAAGAHEPAQPGLFRSIALRRLVLEDPVRMQIAVPFEEPLDCGRSEGADELVLQILDAHEEAEPFQVGQGDVLAEAGSFERPLEEVRFTLIHQTSKGDIQPTRTEELHVALEVRGTAHGDDGDPLGGQVTSLPARQSLDGELIAGPFDQNDGPSGYGRKSLLAQGESEDADPRGLVALSPLLTGHPGGVDAFDGA